MMRFRPFLSPLFLLTLVAALAPPAHAHLVLKSPALTVCVEEEGVTSIDLDAPGGGTRVGDGKWEAIDAGRYFPREPDEITAGALTSRSAALLAPNKAQVVHAYERAEIRYTYTLAGEDLTIAAAVTNTARHGHLATFGWEGLTFHYGQSVRWQLNSWGHNYLRTHHRRVMYPSHDSPRGGQMAVGTTFGLGVWHFDWPLRHRLIQFKPLADQDAPDRMLQSFALASIRPGDTTTISLTLRIAAGADCTREHLLAGYKAAVREVFPQLTYHPDARPIAKMNIARPNSARPDHREFDPVNNPYAINPDRRIDRAAVAEKWGRDIAAGLVAMGGQGLILWDPYGFHHRGSMYRADFDVVPPEVAANLPIFWGPSIESGLRWGYCARPGEVVSPVRWATDDPTKASADNVHRPGPSASFLAMIEGRFARAGGNLYYLDSFGSTLDDLTILAHLRRVLGPDFQLYTEQEFDLTYAFAGVYASARLDGAGQLTFDKQQVRDFASWLFDVPVPVIVQDRSGRPRDEVLAWSFDARVQLLHDDYRLRGAGYTAQVRALVDRYIDPATRWWRQVPLPPATQPAP